MNMLGFNSNKSKWKQLAETCEDSQFRKAMLEMFIPYNISVKKYTVNINCLKTNSIQSSEYSQYCTPSMEEWALTPTWNMPMGIPYWFYPAFPEVVTWTSTPEARIHLESILEGKDSSELESEDHKLRISILQKTVETYINVTHRKLEVTD